MITLKAKNFQENRCSQAVAPWSVKIGTPDQISVGANKQGPAAFDAGLRQPDAVRANLACGSAQASQFMISVMGYAIQGKVTFACEGGKAFRARLADDGSSVRIRYEGGYELENKGCGVYEGDGFKLLTQGATELSHNGKLAAKNCKPV